MMRAAFALPGFVLSAVLVAAGAGAQPAPVAAPAVKTVAPVTTAVKGAAPAAPPAKSVTPNAERVVSIGAIDKRTGATKTFEGNPGQMFRFGALTVTVRTCETTPPWEQKLSGAFLLIDETTGRAAAKRIYSGWMFGESPSLHPLEHARYDIWVKSCTMRFPDTGPDTVLAGSVGGTSAGGDDKPKASKAKKSPATPSAEAN